MGSTKLTMFRLKTFLSRDESYKIFLAEPVYDGEAILRIGLSPEHKQTSLQLGLLPVLLLSVELVERHLAGVSLYGHNVRLNLNYIKLSSEQNTFTNLLQ